MNRSSRSMLGKYLYPLFRWGLAGLFLCMVISCAAPPVPKSELWQQQYQHLNYTAPADNHFSESEYYIVFLVNARHLDYSSSRILFDTVGNIDDKLRRSRVGHSWIYLKGVRNGKDLILEGGQSVGYGKRETGFVEGVMNLVNYGYANPTADQKKQYRHEPDPIRHLWSERNDGYFHRDKGDLSPTYAAKIDLTEEQFENIRTFMDPANYPYEKFSLTGSQCSSFVAQVARLAGVELEHSVTIDIPPEFTVDGRSYRLWTDTRYSKLTFSTPDVLERSLMRLVMEGRAEYALEWYKHRNDQPEN